MGILLFSLLVAGVVAGIFLDRGEHKKYRIYKVNNKLDLVDDMILYGEVTNDSFYKP